MPSDPMTIPGLSKEAREAVKAAFDALSTWRIEVTDNNEKNSKRVIERMAAAAAALGWPEQVVDAARTQMRSITEMQIKTIDGIMNTWDAQLKSPSATSSSATLSSTKPFSARDEQFAEWRHHPNDSYGPLSVLDGPRGTVAETLD